MTDNIIRVLVFGTFDLFHKGHEYFLQQAKHYGDELFVVVARDDTVCAVKGRAPLHTQHKRKSILESKSYVHKVIMGQKKDKYSIIEKVRPDVIVLGYDQTHFVGNLAHELKKRKIVCKIVRLKKSHKPHIYKSSLLREKKLNTA